MSMDATDKVWIKPAMTMHLAGRRFERGRPARVHWQVAARLIGGRFAVLLKGSQVPR